MSLPYPSAAPEEAELWRAASAINGAPCRADLIDLATASHPLTSALRRSRRGGFTLGRLEPHADALFPGHVLFRMGLVYRFAHERAHEREWEWEMALGPSGVRRLSGNPFAVAELFTASRPPLDPSHAHAFASVLDDALDPRAMSGERRAGTFPSLLEAKASNWSSSSSAFRFVASDEASRARLDGVQSPKLERVGGNALLTFFRAVDPGLFMNLDPIVELRMHRVTIDRATGRLADDVRVLGAVTGRSEMTMLGGRPFASRARAAPRGDWGGGA